MTFGIKLTWSTNNPGVIDQYVKLGVSIMKFPREISD